MADQFLPLQAQSFILAGSGAALGATSIILTSFKQIDGTTNITMADLGGLKAFMTLDPGNGTQEESITFSSLTQNANGTCTLTGVKTALFASPYTETSGLAKSHTGGSKAILSNTSAFYNDLTSKDNDETINGLYTFVQFPQKSGVTTPTIAAELASKAYVDLTATGTAVTNQILVSGTSGEGLTAGNVVYLKPVDQKWYIASSAQSSTCINVTIGIAQSTVAISTSVNVLLQGRDANQTGLTAGTNYYLSTAGGISATKGANIIFLGVAQSTTALIFQPDDDSQNLKQDGSRTYASDTGVTDAFIALITPVITGLKEGQHFEFTANHSNTGAATLQINTLIAKNIKKSSNGSVAQALVAGDIKTNLIVGVTYTGGQFLMMSPGVNEVTLSAGALPAVSAINLVSVNIPGLYSASQVQGNIIYKPAGSWTVLAPGTSGQYLGTGGSAANPSWSVPTGISDTLQHLSDDYWTGNEAQYTVTETATATVVLLATKLALTTSTSADTQAKIIPSQQISFASDAIMESVIAFSSASATVANRDVASYIMVGTSGADIDTDVDKDAPGDCFGFMFLNDSSGLKLQAYTSNASTPTITNVTGSLTLTNWNQVRAVFTAGVNVTFYVNGTLVATHTTNLPNDATGNKIWAMYHFDYGNSGTATARTVNIGHIVVRGVQSTTVV